MPDRVVLAGNNAAAIYGLDLLLDWLEPAGILTLAPPTGETPSWQRSLADHARTRGVDCFQPGDPNAPEAVARIAEHRPQLLLSIYYTKLFSRSLLDTIDGPCLNFHPSLLPRHRGVAPLIWSIIEGDQLSGVSVHHLDKGVDTGALVLQRPMPVHPEDTGYSLHGKAARLVRAAAAELIRRLASGAGLPPAVPQTGPPSSHSLDDQELNHIDWSWPRERIRNVVRALAPPLPGAYAVLDDKRLVLSCVATPRSPRDEPRPPGTLEPGQNGELPVVWASDGPLTVHELVVEGERRAGRELGSALDLDSSRQLG